MKTKVLPIALMCFSLIGASGCNQNQNLTLKVVENYKGECEIGLPIDLGYYFYCSDFKAKSINVTYNDGEKNVTIPVYGEIFIPSVSGKHTFTCSAGGKSVSVDVTVVEAKPFISIDSSTYFHEVNPKFPKIELEDLALNVSTSYSPSTAKLEIEKVEYAPFNLNITKGEMSYTEIPSTKESFNATNKGHYRVTANVVNGDRKDTGVYNVICDTSINNGNQYVKKTASGNRYCSARVVVDESNPNAFLLPAAMWKRGASFVTLANEYSYYDDQGKTIPDEITIRFKGKNIPSIGLYTQPDKTSGSFSNNAISEGYILSWEQRNLIDRYTVAHTSSTFILKTVYSNHPEYAFGIQDLEDDSYYRLKFGLKTMENKNGDYTHLHSVGWTIQKIINIGTPEESYEELSERAYYLPYDAGGWWDKYPDRKGYVTFYSSSLQDITFEIER